MSLLLYPRRLENMSGWQDKIVSKLPKSVDISQLVERLRMTPMERLKVMIEFRDGLLGAKSSNANKLSKPD